MRATCDLCSAHGSSTRRTNGVDVLGAPLVSGGRSRLLVCRHPVGMEPAQEVEFVFEPQQERGYHVYAGAPRAPRPRQHA
jgi:hypothetical protein